MQNNPLSISVLTATYNATKHLPNLIQSLRSQTDRNFEWIVVDGMSNDGTVQLLRDAGDLVTQWLSESDCGIYDALNKALKISTGDYYLVVGSDDRLDPDAIANYRMAAEESGADIVTAPIRADNVISRWRNGPSWLYGQFAYVSAHSVGSLFKRNLHDRFGFYSKKYPIAADQHFILRACKNGAKVHRVSFIAGDFSLTGVSSRDVAGVLSESFRVQLENEGRFLQLLLFFVRLIKNCRRLGKK